ncbi:MAG: MATE family efflux transporter [Lachnospiraceae bacterium]|nr:MATE family efflux transporter [Lachnospiraceae bacterium]
MTRDLTKGPVMKAVLLFTGPMLLGNLLQQCYNMADTWIVGRALGPEALAAVGSAFTLMTFLTSILIGLCMGAGALCAIYFGRQDSAGVARRMKTAFAFIGAVAVILQAASMLLLDEILYLMRIPEALYGMMCDYVWIILCGILFIFLYNYFACMLRAVGNSIVPLVFLGIGTVGNIVMDYLFVIIWHMGVKGAAAATVAAQAFSGIGILVYSLRREPVFHGIRLWRQSKPDLEQETSDASAQTNAEVFREVAVHSLAASVQQSIMNFGILMIQSLVNSFGTVVMAAFTVGVKIDAFAYMPVQEFGNAFSVFVAQNYGAGEEERMRQGVKKSVVMVVLFSLTISGIVYLFAPSLIRIFVEGAETEIIQAGTHYLRTEGMFYFGIGLLFLFYGYYRAVDLPVMSVVLTVISLGTRVALSYQFAPLFGESMIWYSIPAGWLLADALGTIIYFRVQRAKESR